MPHLRPRTRLTRLAALWLACAGLCAGLCAGCSGRDMAPEQPEQPGVEVYFRLVTGGLEGPAASRADMGNTWHNTEDREAGDDYENAVNAATFYISAKKGSVEQLAALVPLMVHEPMTDAATGRAYYECVGRVRPDDLSKITGATCRLTAMVNVPAPQAVPGTMQALSAQTYQVRQYGHGKTYLPMWGVTTFTFPALPQGQATKVTLPTPLYLLRAVAKIEVVLNMADPDADPRSFAGTGAYFDCGDAQGAFTPGKCYMTPCLDRGYVMAIGGIDAADTRDLNMYHTEAVMPPENVSKIPQHTLNTTDPHQSKLEFYVPPYQPSKYFNVPLTYPSPNPYEADGHITGYYPQVRVTLSAPSHATVTDVVTLNQPELPGIEGGSLQRNHLYRVTLHRSGVSGLRFSATIADMVDGGAIEFEYDNPSMGGGIWDDNI